MINGVAVAIFGMILSAAFCDIIWTKKNRLLMVSSMILLLSIQGIFYIWLGTDGVRELYPIILHLPLAIIIYFLSKKCLWSIVSVLTAYLCCQLRRWLSLLIVAIFSGGELMQNITESVITLPLLILLLQLIAPAVRSFSHHTTKIQFQFGLIPILSYSFDYLTRVYTNLLAEGTPVIAEFMFFICSVIYLISILCISEERQTHRELKATQDCLNLQITQAIREIELMQKSQQKAKIYRHDLRHHLQYLSTCIENGRLEQAQTYIHEICSEIEANKVTVYCKNEAANLILSAFAGRAEEQKISFEVKADIPQILTVAETDLCILLSNALDNAIHACQEVTEKGLPSSIEVLIYEKNNKLFIQITNTCNEYITFVHGVPVAKETGHGIGVRSICALVEKYNGIYNFSVKNGKFTLQVSF